jgi:hypothetical protein
MLTKGLSEGRALEDVRKKERVVVGDIAQALFLH